MLHPRSHRLLLVAFALLAADSATAASITVTGGTTATIPGTYASGTWGSISISGTGPSGARSTLTIDNSTVLTAEPFLAVTDGGLLSMRADITSTIGGVYAYGSGTVSRGGTLDLVSGTLTAEYFTLSGSDAFRRSGGAYALGNLAITDGATASFQAGDVIGRQRYGAIWVTSGGTLALGTTLSSTNGVGLGLSGSSSRLVRITGAETLRVSGVGLVHSAALDLIPGDAIPSMTVTGSSVLTLAPGATSLRLSNLSYGSGGRVAGLERIPYDIDSVEVFEGQRLEYRGGAIDDQIRTALYATDSGTVSLSRNLTFSSGTIPGVPGLGYLAIAGAGSSLEQNGHTVAVREFRVLRNATHTADADVVATTAEIAGGGRIELTAGRFTVSGTATVSGAGSFSVDRSTGGSYDISTLSLRDAATADFNPLTDRVHNLSLGTATRFTTLATGSGLTLDSLELTGTVAQTRLVLGGFASEGSGGAWGLRMGESYTSTLQSLVSAGTIVSSAGQTLSVARQGGYAYVITGTTTPTPPTPPTTQITITVASGTQTQTQAGYATLTGSVSLLKRGAGTLVIQAGNTMTGSTAVQDGTLRFAGGGLASSTVVPLAGGTVAVGQDWVAVGGLLPLAGGLVDVERNLLFVQAGLSEADIRTAILAGLGDGSWNGAAGITSTTVAAEQALGLPRAIGWAPMWGDELSVGYAAIGDTNLDWSVDVLDAADVLARGKYDSGQPAGWYEGDFNYDAAVDILDAASFVSTGLYDTGVYRPLPVFQDSGPVAAVPEPDPTLAAGVLLAVVAWAATRRS